MDPQDARKRLEAVLAELDASTQTLRDTGDNTDTRDSINDDQDPLDEASDMVAADREEASAEIVSAQRERVVAALARIDDGSYGKCLTCGDPIPDERLDAIPEAERDVVHQQEFEAAR